MHSVAHCVLNAQSGSRNGRAHELSLYRHACRFQSELDWVAGRTYRHPRTGTQRERERAERMQLLFNQFELVMYRHYTLKSHCRVQTTPWRRTPVYRTKSAQFLADLSMSRSSCVTTWPRIDHLCTNRQTAVGSLRQTIHIYREFTV